VVIAEVARSNYGNVTRAQLLELLSHAAIVNRVAVGRLHRVYRGVYAVGRAPVAPLERASAAVLACGPGAVLSHGSAMTLWGFWKRWDEPFEVTVVGDRRTTGIVVHRSTTLARRDLTKHLGINLTSPARTIFDTAPRLDDRALKRTVNSALNSPWLAESHLAELVTRQPGRRQACRIAPLIGLAGTPTRSDWAAAFPAFCKQHGLPVPVMGARVNGYIVDALFTREKVIVELDSWQFHRHRIAFETDRERDAEALVNGFLTVRITWERIHAAPEKEADRLGRILAAQAPRAA